MDQLSSATHYQKDKLFFSTKLPQNLVVQRTVFAMKSNVAWFLFIMVMFNLLPDKAFKKAIEAIPVIAMST